ncbi:MULTISPECIES: DUF6447 family protein [Methylotuvimicrobium]|uniref:Phage protein n=2 Tax=Methylotuvimicrobium TaxID=2822410 RepID=G4T3W3_META2|nr:MULTISPECIES: DUF6447 family protein [Methylotuvimicrobium]QCW83502.1 hypothetical protein EQU24_15550 [Methylotuvimicrobium buryatense]CCE22662.1 conserved protein of unknown function [Methylotuvimicrobium alcaliphilum 20Z]
MSEANKQIVTINGIEYDLNDLSENAKNQINNLRVTDAEIQRLNTLLGIAQTARAAYARVLNDELAKDGKEIYPASGMAN